MPAVLEAIQAARESGQMGPGDCGYAVPDGDGAFRVVVDPECRGAASERALQERRPALAEQVVCIYWAHFQLQTPPNRYTVGGRTSCNHTMDWIRITSELYWYVGQAPVFLSRWNRYCPSSAYCSSVQTTHLWEGDWLVINLHEDYLSIGSPPYCEYTTWKLVHVGS
jgi:hypothetical protein